MIHSCIEVHIEDTSEIAVSMQKPCCCNPINIHTVESQCDMSIKDNNGIFCSIEWVCGVGFSERYLCGCDSELITVDGNYLVVKYKPKA